MKLKDTVIVITGGSCGLGKALATVFLDNDADVIISGNNKKELRRAAKDLACDAIVADVTKKKDMRRLVQKVLRRKGALDIFINNAGYWTPHRPTENLDEQDIRNMMDVNLFGCIFGTQAVLPYFKKKNNGIIVNINSVSGIEGHAGSGGYCASKFAANGFSLALREELRATNIRVVNVYPDKMRTCLFDASRPKNYKKYMNPADVAEKIAKNLAKKHPRYDMVIRTV